MRNRKESKGYINVTLIALIAAIIVGPILCLYHIGKIPSLTIPNVALPNVQLPKFSLQSVITDKLPISTVQNEVTISRVQLVKKGFLAAAPYVDVLLYANQDTYPDTIYYVEVIAFDNHSIGKQSVKWPQLRGLIGYADIGLKYYLSEDDSVVQAMNSEEKLPISQRHLTTSDLVRVVITK